MYLFILTKPQAHKTAEILLTETDDNAFKMTTKIVQTANDLYAEHLWSLQNISPSNLPHKK